MCLLQFQKASPFGAWGAYYSEYGIYLWMLSKWRHLKPPLRHMYESLMIIQ